MRLDVLGKTLNILGKLTRLIKMSSHGCKAAVLTYGGVTGEKDLYKSETRKWTIGDILVVEYGSGRNNEVT